MVTLTIGALVLPWGLEQLISSPPVPAELGLPAVLLIASGLMGFGTGFLIPISRRRTRSLDQRIRRLQDALAKDFYIEQIYQITIVALVKACSDAVSWFDKTIVDGLVNVVGIATLGGGEGLRYSVSGRSQSYLVTMLVGVAALMLLIFLLSQLPAFA
jgi:NAD(P)H-quinone oxidoreductase subunit 5